MWRRRSKVSLGAMAWRSCATCILVLGVVGRITAVASDITNVQNGTNISATEVTNRSSGNENGDKQLTEQVTTKIVASRRVADESFSSGRYGVRGNSKGQYDIPGQLDANGIECYSCSNCATVNHLTARKRCPSSQNPSTANKCVQFSQIYNALNGTWWVRGCPQERGSCKDIQANLNHPSIVRVDTCLECEGDLCNSGFLGAPLAISMTTLAILTCLAKFFVS